MAIAEGPHSRVRWLAATLVLSAPALAAFVILALTGTLPWQAAGLAAVGAVVLLGLLLLHFHRLRKALNAEGEDDLIRTVRAAGYALDQASI